MKIEDVLPDDEKRKEKILHAVKKVAQMQVMLDSAIDNLVKEVIRNES